MKGLLLKDWYMTVKYWRITLLISGLFLVLSAIKAGNSFFTFYPCAMMSMLPASLLSYDDREKWTDHVQTLPVSRRDYVTGKYLFGVLAIAAYLLVLTLLYLVLCPAWLPDALLFSVFIGTLVPALTLPFLFRFGSEKGRIVYLLTIGAVFGILAASSLSDNGTPLRHFASLPTWSVPPASLLIYALSWRISLRMFEKRMA